MNPHMFLPTVFIPNQPSQDYGCPPMPSVDLHDTSAMVNKFSMPNPLFMQRLSEQWGSCQRGTDETSFDSTFDGSLHTENEFPGSRGLQDTFCNPFPTTRVVAAPSIFQCPQASNLEYSVAEPEEVDVHTAVPTCDVTIMYSHGPPSVAEFTEKRLFTTYSNNFEVRVRGLPSMMVTAVSMRVVDAISLEGDPSLRMEVHGVSTTTTIINLQHIVTEEPCGWLQYRINRMRFRFTTAKDGKKVRLEITVHTNGLEGQGNRKLTFHSHQFDVAARKGAPNDKITKQKCRRRSKERRMAGKVTEPPAADGEEGGPSHLFVDCIAAGTP
jgi:hypothetical protein